MSDVSNNPQTAGIRFRQGTCLDATSFTAYAPVKLTGPNTYEMCDGTGADTDNDIAGIVLADRQPGQSRSVPIALLSSDVPLPVLVDGSGVVTAGTHWLTLSTTVPYAFEPASAGSGVLRAITSATAAAGVVLGAGLSGSPTAPTPLALTVATGISNSTVADATLISGLDSAMGAVGFDTGNSGQISFWRSIANAVADGYPYATYSNAHGFQPFPTNLRNWGDAAHVFSDSWSQFRGTVLGDPIDSTGANITIALTATMHHVTNTGSIQTITPPSLQGGSFVGQIILIPDAAFTLTLGGNIAKVSTAVANRPLVMTYDGTSWYPGY